MPWFSATAAAAIAAAVVVAVRSAAATAADQQKNDDNDPRAPVKTIVAHVVFPPFVYTTVYVKYKKVLQIHKKFQKG